MKSMTGFGKSTTITENFRLDIEIKTVNHRFLDIQMRLPRECNAYEMPLRQLIQKYLGRGRVECAISLQVQTSELKEVKVHWDLLNSLKEQLQSAEAQHQFDTPELLQGLALRSDFFEVVDKPSNHEEELAQALTETMEKALQHLVEVRSKEGAGIKELFQQYLQAIQNEIAQITSVSELYEKDYQERLTAKIAELTDGRFDENRILTEVAIMLEKGDIHEELDRLGLHIQEAEKLIASPEAIGRQFDFLIQEMNREVNTIGSKSASLAIKNSVVQMKTTIEKIREQVQNVE